MATNILKPEEIETLRSMSIYWKEVRDRPGGNTILRQEMSNVYEMLGPDTILKIIEEHIKKS